MPTKPALVLCLMPILAQAETDITALTPQERSSFAAEVRALLLQDPALVTPAFGPSPAMIAQDQYAEEIDNDLALLERHATDLFPAKEPLALFYDPALMPDLPDQVRATTGRPVALHPLTDIATDPLANALGLDMLPFYVTNKTMLRGDFPLQLLARYLD